MYNLRPYQEDTVNSLRVELKKHNKVLIAAATGFGKTKVSQWVIERLNENGKKSLFTTPRIKLTTQTQKSFGFGNIILGTKTKENNSNCTIGSIQSIYSRKIKDHFDYIFIDECHYAHGSKYINYIFKTYPNAKIIGLSATPIDEKGFLLHGYDSIVHEISVKDLIKQGFLVDVEVYTSTKQPQLKEVSIINGDYNQTESSGVMRENEILSNSLQEWERLAKGLKTIVFATDIEHCEQLKEEFNKKGILVGAVHSKMSEKDVEKAYKDFNKDKVQVLINVDMATFGFDEPSIECMLFVRPIKSLRLYKQMVGRGLRIHPHKIKCLMIDCANVVYDNGYPTDEIVFIKKPVINKTVDRIAKIERETDGSVSVQKNSKERIEYLEKIGSLIDLYKNKSYLKEQDLVDDCKKILKRAGYYMWRQNSGKMFVDNRWVHFTDKNGLPDITLIYHSVYIGLELKLPQGRLTKYQKETLPEFKENKVCYFIIENVVDLFEVLEKVRESIIKKDGGIFIKDTLYELSERQKEYRIKHKL